MQIYVFSAENRMLTAKNNTSVQVFYDAFRPTYAPTRLTGIAQGANKRPERDNKTQEKCIFVALLMNYHAHDKKLSSA